MNLQEREGIYQYGFISIYKEIRQFDNLILFYTFVKVFTQSSYMCLVYYFCSILFNRREDINQKPHQKYNLSRRGRIITEIELMLRIIIR